MRVRKCFSIRRYGACNVISFLDLAEKVAHLQFKNPNYVMLFRGQKKITKELIKTKLDFHPYRQVFHNDTKALLKLNREPLSKLGV